MIVYDIGKTYPKESALLGKMLLSYAELEGDLLRCVYTATGDFDCAVKAMYRTRGETQRLSIGDALGRHKYHDLKLGTEFEMAIGTMQHCLKIRNQYAHCVWYPHEKAGLTFINFEEMANENKRLDLKVNLDLHRVDMALLKKQYKYFVYALEQLGWLIVESEVRLGKERKNNRTKPKQRERPGLHNPWD